MPRTLRVLLPFLLLSAEACAPTYVAPTCSNPADSVCDGHCVDLGADPNFCGDCSSSCTSGSACVNGTCVGAPAATTGLLGPNIVPPAEEGNQSPYAAPVAFAIRTLYAGDSDRAGTSSMTAWADYGLDLDGAQTTDLTPNTCQLASGAAITTQIDGFGGIDNSFGANLLPTLEVVFGWNPTQQFTAAIGAGEFTEILAVAESAGAGPASATTQSYLVGGAPLGRAPSWTGSDVWPVDESTLTGSSLSSASLSFAKPYWSDSLLVAAPPSGTGFLRLVWPVAPANGVDTVSLVLPVTRVQVVLNVDANGVTATGGTLAGIIPVQAFLATAQTFAASLDTKECSQSYFSSFATQIVQAADILQDGTQDPTRTCDGISFGFGFDAVRVTPGAPVKVPPAPAPCP